MTEQTTPAPEAQPIPLPADAPVYRPGEDEAEDAAWIDGWNEGCLLYTSPSPRD